MSVTPSSATPVGLQDEGPPNAAAASAWSPALSKRAPGWPRAMLALAATLALIVLLYHDTAQAIVGIWWRSETFQHAFLVLPIVGWLIWRMRDRLAPLRPMPAPLWLLPICLVGFGWLLGDLGEVNAVTQFTFVALLVLAVPAVLGTTLARAMMFPLGFMFFTVPLGEFTMPWLMARTADFTVWALQASGIPVWREGQLFVIPSGAWSVVEACSGVRYLIASVMVGTLFAYVNFHSMRRRLGFIAVATLIPVVANWARAYLIVMLGHLSGNKLATGVDHLIYGWVFFAIVMALMFMVGIRWSEPEAAGAPASVASADITRSTTRPRFFAIAILVFAATTLPFSALHVIDSNAAPMAVRLGAFNLSGSGWQPQGIAPDWTPAFVGANARVGETYRRVGSSAGVSDGASAGSLVGLSIDYYRHQGDGHKLVSSVNALVATNDKRWRLLDAGTQAIDAGDRRIVARRARLNGFPGAPNAAATLRVWQFYWVDDELTGSDVAAKAWGVVQRLRHGRDDGAAIILSTPDGPAADAALVAFVHDNLGAITAGLVAARDAR